jgi:xanthine/CO dehydrogenase XdhC/CoxF family maturation factor
MGDGGEGGKRLLGRDVLSFSDLSEACLDRVSAFVSGTDCVLLLESAGSQVIVERVDNRRSLFVFGAGHVGRSVALMGVMLGLRVVLIDDRREFLEWGELLGNGIEPLLADFGALRESVQLLSSRRA